MARGVNKVILVGTCGKDPETRYMPNGGAVANISIATNESWTDKNTGQKQERTEWHNITFFGRLGEIAGEYLRKGSQVYIEGSLRTEKYTGKDGIERYSTKIIANEMQMLGSKKEGQSDGYRPQNQAQNNAIGGVQSNAGYDNNQMPQGMQDQPNMDDFDDDIPF